MDLLLWPHHAYAMTYLDDVVIHSESWKDDLAQRRKMLSELRWAGQSANPRKCHLSLIEVQYLGYKS